MSDSPSMYVKLHVGPPPELRGAVSEWTGVAEPETVTHRRYYARNADGAERPVDAGEALAILLGVAR